MNTENSQNAEAIGLLLQSFFEQSHETTILDICCGVFYPDGINYDKKGEIYQPLVAQYLGERGFSVTGIDTRKNVSNIPLHYNHLNTIDIVEPNWQLALEKNWNAVLFLRSWDTPEILLHYQKLLNITDLNTLCLRIAQLYIPVFADLLKTGGIFFTTEIINQLLCKNQNEVKEYELNINNLFVKNNLYLLGHNNGLYWYRKG